MKLSFKQMQLPEDQDRLVNFLVNERWPFHVNTNLTHEKVTEMLASGLFSGANHECHWILDSLNSEIGFIRLMDLEDIGDGYPLFDLRLQASSRGKGIGRETLHWMVRYMFTK